MVNTEALPEEMLVRTRQVEGFVVNSRGGAAFEILTDEQMLALAQDQSVALVRMGGVTEVKWFGL